MADRRRRFTLERSARALADNASSAGPAAAASYTLIGAIILLGGIGYAIDVWRGTSPWGFVVGIFTGIAVGFYELVRTIWRGGDGNRPTPG
jgi:F0F1-type ATP synthase assembly protein I